MSHNTPRLANRFDCKGFVNFLVSCIERSFQNTDAGTDRLSWMFLARCPTDVQQVLCSRSTCHNQSDPWLPLLLPSYFSLAWLCLSVLTLSYTHSPNKISLQPAPCAGYCSFCAYLFALFFPVNKRKLCLLQASLHPRLCFTPTFRHIAKVKIMTGVTCYERKRRHGCPPAQQRTSAAADTRIFSPNIAHTYRSLVVRSDAQTVHLRTYGYLKGACRERPVNEQLAAQKQP